MSTYTPPTISFGFLLIPFQALDVVGPMDILSNIAYDTIYRWVSPSEAERLKTSKIEFHYIGPTMDPVQTTGNLHITPTCTVNNCPKLDYLLIGGPAPSYALSLPTYMKHFILEKSKEVTTIFTTCTGGLVLAATGLLDGLEATVNHTCLLEYGPKVSPTTKWNRDKYWVVSGEGKKGVTFWTAAGAGSGMDMMAEWLRTELEFGRELLDFSTMMLEWQPRDVDGRPMSYVNGRREKVGV